MVDRSGRCKACETFLIKLVSDEIRPSRLATAQSVRGELNLIRATQYNFKISIVTFQPSITTIAPVSVYSRLEASMRTRTSPLPAVGSGASIISRGRLDRRSA